LLNKNPPNLPYTHFKAVLYNSFREEKSLFLKEGFREIPGNNP
jgi:hypothetical protein